MIKVYGIWACLAGFILWMGWPFWPLLLLTSAILTVCFWRSGADWRVPFSALVGYGVMRGVVLLNDEFGMYVSGALWLAIGAYMIRRGWHWQGFAYCNSGAVYPIFALLGMRIEYLGIVAIITELFAIIALLGIAGGLRGTSVDRPFDHRRRAMVLVGGGQARLAQNKSPMG